MLPKTCGFRFKVFTKPGETPVPFLERLRLYVPDSMILGGLDALDGIFSLFACVLFVWGSYYDTQPGWMYHFEVLFTVFFGLGWTFRLSRDATQHVAFDETA